MTYQQRLWVASVLCILALVALACQASCIVERPNRPLVDPVIYGEYARTVEVEALCTSGNMQGGSAVRIDDTHVLTAKHVIVCGDGDKGVPSFMVAVLDRGGTAHIARVVSTTSRDLAVLKVTGLAPIGPVRIAAPVVGERACATFELPEIGRRCGEVWPHKATSLDDLLVAFPAEHGNSGGPLWDPDGRLIGVVTVLRWCQGIESPQVCTAGAMSLTSLGPKFAVAQ